MEVLLRMGSDGVALTTESLFLLQHPKAQAPGRRLLPAAIAGTICTISLFGREAEPAAPLLIEATRHAWPTVRAFAIHALARVAPSTEKNVRIIAEFLEDPDPWVRKMAADSLGQLGKSAKSALPALTDALDDGNPDVQKAARLALRKINGPMPKVGYVIGGVVIVVLTFLAWRRLTRREQATFRIS